MHHSEESLHQEIFELVDQLKALSASVGLFVSGDKHGDEILKEQFRESRTLIKKYDPDFILPREMRRLTTDFKRPA